jgi:RecJ-like exonuclease
MIFFRFCISCGNRFKPEGKHEKLCKECRKKVKNVNFIKMICHRNGIEINNNRGGNIN